MQLMMFFHLTFTLLFSIFTVISSSCFNESGVIQFDYTSQTYSTLKSPAIGYYSQGSIGPPKKAFVLPANSGWVTVANFTGSGVVKRVWFALAGDKEKTFITITTDGATTPQFGNFNPQPPNTPNNMNFDQLFTCSFLVGCNYNSGPFKLKVDNVIPGNKDQNLMGVFMDINIPFNSSFVVQLWNTASTTQTLWTNFETSFEPVTSPLRLFSKRINLLSLSYPNEYPLLSVSSPNGVQLKFVKMIMVDGGSAWIEGRIKVYCGPVQMTSSINQNHWTDSSYQIPTPCVLDSCTPSQLGRMLTWSTGWEDYFLSAFSCNFGSGLPNTDEHGGCMYYASDSNGNPRNIVALRSYDDKSAPKCLPGEYLTITTSTGDILTGAGGTVSFAVGDVIYYA